MSCQRWDERATRETITSRPCKTKSDLVADTARLSRLRVGEKPRLQRQKRQSRLRFALAQP